MQIHRPPKAFSQVEPEELNSSYDVLSTYALPHSPVTQFKANQYSYFQVSSLELTTADVWQVLR
ncbi:hypothetical protein C0J52_01518 [Blattella germanica]|nr:hypothetical protein C0J52_01518 [Blattella germanica]